MVRKFIRSFFVTFPVISKRILRNCSDSHYHRILQFRTILNDPCKWRVNVIWSTRVLDVLWFFSPKTSLDENLFHSPCKRHELSITWYLMLKRYINIIYYNCFLAAKFVRGFITPSSYMRGIDFVCRNIDKKYTSFKYTTVIIKNYNVKRNSYASLSERIHGFNLDPYYCTRGVFRWCGNRWLLLWWSDFRRVVNFYVSNRVMLLTI